MCNITEIRENGQLYARYAYDNLNRLIREENRKLDKTVLWTYDNNGNILSKSEYAFTLKDKKDLDEMTATVTNYSYDGDKLLYYGNSMVSYNQNRPAFIRGMIYQWSENKVTGINGNTFAYDGFGRRTSKNLINYTYDSEGRVVRQSNGLDFIYDHTGVAAVKYADATYIYRKDAQGNIIAMLDTAGKIVVKYV